MDKLKQHFVPQFYLRFFQSRPRRINLYNINSALPVKDAGIRQQCYRRHFYGHEPEKQLMLLENRIAPALRRVISNRRLPPYQSEEYTHVISFVSLQILRTLKYLRNMDDFSHKIMEQAYSGVRNTDIDIEGMMMPKSEKVDLVLHQLLPDALEGISDLRSCLVFSPRKDFITSDNPTFRYNQYCEHVQHQGVTGFQCKGIQIFVPLSPSLQLILYDGTTYGVRSLGRFSHTIRATKTDVDNLNMIQLVSADENIYFSNWEQLQDIYRLLPKAKYLRNLDPAVVQEYGQDDDPNSSLIHAYESVNNISLTLAFLRIKRRARRVPLMDRLMDRRGVYRKQSPRSHPEGRVTTFSRFLGRR